VISTAGSSALTPSGSADEALILSAIGLPLGKKEKYKRRWIEFDCANGVHHGKWSTYINGERKREEGGHIGRFDVVAALGVHGRRRVQEFISNHASNCHYPERFQKDLEECGFGGIEVESWPSGRSYLGLADGQGRDPTSGATVHDA
jgi:hypothetical protein